MSAIDLTEAIRLWARSVIPPLNRMIRLTTVFSMTTFLMLRAATSQVITTTSHDTLNISLIKTNIKPTSAAQPDLEQSSKSSLNYNQDSPCTPLSHHYLIATTTSSQLPDRIAPRDLSEKDDSRLHLSQQTSMITARISEQATTEERSQHLNKITTVPQLETRDKLVWHERDTTENGWPELQLQTSTQISSASTLGNASLTQSGMRPGRRRRAAATSSQMQAGSSQQPSAIQALTGQRLVIPCRNSTRNFLDANGRQRQVAQVAGATQGGRFRITTSNNNNSSSNNNNNNLAPQAMSISLIVWHKDDQLNSPIFAADARGSGGSMRDAKQQVISEQLRGRVRLELVPPELNPSQLVPALVIDEANMQDAGRYTCTVEFHKAPTQTYQMQVQVSDPPKNMIISDGTNNNQRIYSTLAGPYDEDSRLELVCEVEPGQPQAGQVSWWQLDSVTYLGELKQQLGRAAGQKMQAQVKAQSSLSLLNEANYLTTLSFDGPAESSSTGLDSAPDSSATRVDLPYASRDLYLGPGSLQSLELTHVPPQAYLQLQSQSDSAGAHLRHWIRVENKTQLGEDRLSANLEIQQLSRANLGDEFLCLASNNLQLAPVNSSISLNLNLKPLEVRLIDRTNGTFKLGQKTMVECHVLGSKPSPTIKWFRGGQEVSAVESSSSAPPNGADQTLQQLQQLQQANQISEFNRDINKLTKISYLTLVPQLSDNQQQLTCSAYNPRLTTSSGSGAEMPLANTLSQSITMNVQFGPRLQLKLGTNIWADSIRLGGDVFMDCNIESNPPIEELSWLHNGRPLVANLTSGVYMSNQSLVLRHIKVQQRGSYECQARNQLGQSTSNKLELRPRFEPVCDHTLTRSRYEVPLNHPTRIECHVLAEPNEDLHFTWRFNRSFNQNQNQDQESLEQSQLARIGVDSSAATTPQDQQQGLLLNQYETNFSRGSVMFTPTSRRHFGQLLCSASNSMGKQERPCVIQLVQSEQPGPVFGCFVDNLTDSSFSIHCQPPSLFGAASSSMAPSATSGSNHYILDVYTSDSSSASSSGGGPPQAGDKSARGSDATHLRMRQPDQQDQPKPSSSDSQDYPGDRDEEESDEDTDGTEPLQQDTSNQVRIKRLKSELPSFTVQDLKPNASYKVLVYAENSKGRSPATHHQVSLKPVDGSSQSGQVAASQQGLELFNGKRLRGGQQSQRDSDSLGRLSSNKLLSYLKVDSYFNGSSGARQPLIGVALIVLLSTISIVMVLFFASRLICKSGQRSTNKSKRGPNSSAQKDSRKCSRGPATCGSLASSSPDNYEEGGGEAANSTAVQRRRGSNSLEARALVSMSSGPTRLTTGAANGTQTLAANTNASGRMGSMGAGCGSDTSRETNTDSTLISSAQQTEFSSDSNAGGSRHMGSTMNGLFGQRRCSHQELSQQQAEVGQYCNKSTTMRPAKKMNIMQQQQQQQYIFYSTNQKVHGQLEQQDQSLNTPQVSIHSSECSSNNVDNSIDLVPHHQMQPQQNYSTMKQLEQMGARQNYLLASGKSGCLEADLADAADEITRMASSGVYVISDGSLTRQSPVGFYSANGQQLNQDPIWCSSDSPQSSQMQSQKSNRCHLVGDDTNSPPSLQPTGIPQLLPSSFSIPISLSERLDILARSNSARTSSGAHGHHRMSHEDLHRLQQSQSGCSSYLTLAPSSLVHHQSAQQQQLHVIDYPSACSSQAAAYDTQPQVLGSLGQQDLMPPTDFAADFRRFKQTFCISPGQQSSPMQQQVAPQKHRVKFDTSSSNEPSNALDGD